MPIGDPQPGELWWRVNKEGRVVVKILSRKGTSCELNLVETESGPCDKYDGVTSVESFLHWYILLETPSTPPADIYTTAGNEIYGHLGLGPKEMANTAIAGTSGILSSIILGYSFPTTGYTTTPDMQVAASNGWLNSSSFIMGPNVLAEFQKVLYKTKKEMEEDDGTQK